MSLFSTLNTATSGLGNASNSLSVIGDNIANLNTTAYKGSRTEFADLMPQDVFGVGGPSQLGKGAALRQISTVFSQGAINSSENALDMAVSGDGFFVVSDGVSNYYTRAGEFYLDQDGFVVNAEGYKLQGYGASEGTLGKTMQDLWIDQTPIAPKATETLTMTANLSAEADYSTTELTALDLTSGQGDSLEDVADASDFATSVSIYDSLGVSHEVTLVFERTASDTWSWYAVVDAGEANITALGGPGDDGAAYQIASGEVTFDTDGEISGFTQTDVTGWSFDGGSANPAYTFEFGMDTAGVETDGRVRMNNGDSAVSAVSQDGYGQGTISNLSVDTDGSIIGTYSNGEEMVLGQVVLARFTANGGLERTGGNLWRETTESGPPAIGAPDTGSRGKVAGNSLEQSNVDLEDQFISMITSQRTYQANARVVNTTNDTLQELVNLV